MPKRSITDEEIGLIKAMLARKMKNKDIQFFFNRPNRPVNTGRISTIHNGTYSNSASIAAASDVDLDSFIAHLIPKAVDGSAADSPSAAHGLSGLVRALFGKGSDGAWRLVDGESDRYECKLDFDPNRMTSTVRAAAALANNKGGFIFFWRVRREISSRRRRKRICRD
jgi:hypothetical protein